MSSEGSRLCLFAALGLIGLSAGCASVPAVPEGARPQSPPQNASEHDGGWLWKSLTKQDSTPPSTGSALRWSAR